MNSVKDSFWSYSKDFYGNYLTYFSRYSFKTNRYKKLQKIYMSWSRNSSKPCKELLKEFNRRLSRTSSISREILWIIHTKSHPDLLGKFYKNSFRHFSNVFLGKGAYSRMLATISEGLVLDSDSTSSKASCSNSPCDSTKNSFKVCLKSCLTESLLMFFLLDFFKENSLTHSLRTSFKDSYKYFKKKIGLCGRAVNGASRQGVS